MWDLWWTEWHWDRFSSFFFRFPLSVSFHRVRIHIDYIIWGMNNGHVGGRRSEKIVSPYGHEQHQQLRISAHSGQCKYSPKCNKESNHLQRYKINTGMVVFWSTAPCSIVKVERQFRCEHCNALVMNVLTHLWNASFRLYPRRLSSSSAVAKQSIAARCLVDRCQLFGRSRPVVWSIAASCLVDRCQLFGRSRPVIWSIAASCLLDRG
jgi:hypothetical protein